MSKSRYDLEEIIDLEKWEKQDSLSLVTKMAILTVDYKGVPVTKHSHCQPFCQGVRQDSHLSSYCQNATREPALKRFAKTNHISIYAISTLSISPSRSLSITNILVRLWPDSSSSENLMLRCWSRSYLGRPMWSQTGSLRNSKGITLHCPSYPMTR